MFEPHNPNPGNATKVAGLIGVYNLDDTVLGRAAFKWAGARHRKRCPLFDATHDGNDFTREWESLERQLGAPIQWVARDKRPQDLMVLTGGIVPCIVAVTEAQRSMVVVLAHEIERCAGDPTALFNTIREAIPRWSLSWN